MSLFGEESNGDRLIEDYLSNSQGVRNDDEHFARPIEDEDIFGLNPIEQQSNNFCPEPQTLSAPSTPPTTAKSKLEQFKQNIKDKLLAKGIVPKPLEHGLNKEDLFEIDAGRASDEPVPPARLIFQHAQQKNVKDKYGLYRGQKLKWNAYSDHLKKSMCSVKRKHWDAFQTPADDYDDEEELVETIGDKENDEEDKEDKEDENEEEVDAESGEEEVDEDEESEGSEIDGEEDEPDGGEIKRDLKEDDSEHDELRYFETDDEEHEKQRQLDEELGPTLEEEDALNNGMQQRLEEADDDDKRLRSLEADEGMD